MLGTRGRRRQFGGGICFPHILPAWEGLFRPSSPHLPLLSSLSALLWKCLLRDLHPLFLHKRTLQLRSLSGKSYPLTNRELISRTTSISFPHPSLSLPQLWVLLLSRDPLLQPLLSHFGMLISWDCPLRASLPVPPVPSRTLLSLGSLLSPADTLLGPSSPFWNSHLPVPPAPSSPALLGHSSALLGSHLQPLSPLRCSPLTLPLWEPGSFTLLPQRLHLSD